MTGLQRLLDEFKNEYNSERPHTSLPPGAHATGGYLRARRQPLQVAARTALAVRHDIVDQAGKVTLRIMANCTASGSAATTPEPTSSRSFRTSTSGS